METSCVSVASPNTTARLSDHQLGLPDKRVRSPVQFVALPAARGFDLERRVQYTVLVAEHLLGPFEQVRGLRAIVGDEVRRGHEHPGRQGPQVQVVHIADLLEGAKEVLRDKHGVLHATLQVEPARSRACHELDW